MRLTRLLITVLLTALASTVTTSAAQADVAAEEFRWNLVGGGPPRTDFAMVYDPVRGKTVLFGGAPTIGQGSSETWEWNGSSWTQRTPVTSPPARYLHAMAWDPVNQKVMVVGGCNSQCSVKLADTWEWDGTNWTELHPTTSPPVRNSHSMATDVQRGRVVIFGGHGKCFQPWLCGFAYDDTWIWDGVNWAQGPNGPPARLPSDDFRSCSWWHNNVRKYGQRQSNMALEWNKLDSAFSRDFSSRPNLERHGHGHST